MFVCVRACVYTHTNVTALELIHNSKFRYDVTIIRASILDVRKCNICILTKIPVMEAQIESEGTYFLVRRPYLLIEVNHTYNVCGECEWNVFFSF